MKPLDIPWNRVRVEFSHGASLSQLADKYDVSVGTLKKRSQREEWMSLRPETHATKMSPALVEGAKSAGQSLAERGLAYADRVFTKVSRLVDEANLPAPKTWKDAEVADKIARRAAGLENAETVVNTLVAFGGMDETPVSAPVFEANSDEVVTLPE